MKTYGIWWASKDASGRTFSDWAFVRAENEGEALKKFNENEERRLQLNELALRRVPYIVQLEARWTDPEELIYREDRAEAAK